MTAAPTAPSFRSMLPGLLLVGVVAALAFGLASLDWAARLGLNSLTLAILLGMLLGNTVYPRLSGQAGAGVAFSKGTILRAAIVLYGFRLTLGQLFEIGWLGLLADLIMLGSTFALAYALGTRWLRLDRQTSALIGAGASICGAAAVLATGPVVRAQASQVTVAVATVVIFGTLSMFLYPQLAAWGVWPFEGLPFGLYIGSTVHEVAQVVAAGRAISPEVADAAVTAKMLRVMLLAPFLLLLSAAVAQRSERGVRQPIAIPWFAFGFVAVALFNSLNLLPASWVSGLMILDALLLTMAMAALGLTTHFRAVREAGAKPLLLGLALFFWLVVGGGLVQLGLLQLGL